MSEFQEYKTINVVTGPYTANVNRQPTGLAGCNNVACPVRSGCLRGDEMLSKSVNPEYDRKYGCPLYISF